MSDYKTVKTGSLDSVWIQLFGGIEHLLVRHHLLDLPFFVSPPRSVKRNSKGRIFLRRIQVSLGIMTVQDSPMNSSALGSRVRLQFGFLWLPGKSESNVRIFPCVCPILHENLSHGRNTAACFPFPPPQHPSLIDRHLGWHLCGSELHTNIRDVREQNQCQVYAWVYKHIGFTNTFLGGHVLTLGRSSQQLTTPKTEADKLSPNPPSMPSLSSHTLRL